MKLSPPLKEITGSVTMLGQGEIRKLSVLKVLLENSATKIFSSSSSFLFAAMTEAGVGHDHCYLSQHFKPDLKK